MPRHSGGAERERDLDTKASSVPFCVYESLRGRRRPSSFRASQKTVAIAAQEPALCLPLQSLDRIIKDVASKLGNLFTEEKRG